MHIGRSWSCCDPFPVFVFLFSRTFLSKQYEVSSYYYSLDGRKLSDKPTRKGVYINNGQKVVIK